MKRFSKKAIAAILISLFLVSCLMLNYENIVSRNKVEATEIFHEIFSDEVKEIQLWEFNEEVRVCTDTEKIEIILDALRNADYKKIPEEDYVEGSYMFEFVTEHNNVSAGLGTKHVAIGGQQYACENLPLDNILDIMRNTQH